MKFNNVESFMRDQIAVVFMNCNDKVGIYIKKSIVCIITLYIIAVLSRTFFQEMRTRDSFSSSNNVVVTYFLVVDCTRPLKYNTTEEKRARLTEGTKEESLFIP